MKKKSIGIMLVRILLLCWAALIIIPFAMLVLTSTKTNTEFYEGIWSLPKDFFSSVAYNYKEAWTRGNIGGNFMNTVVISVSSLLLNLSLSSMVSYAITRRKLKSSGAMSTLFLMGLLIPAMVGLTPAFIGARFLHLFNTRIVLIILYTAMTMPFSVFVMTSFFRTIPKELEEAAVIDGASPWRVFGSIMLPLVKPALVSAGIFNFLDYWSEYMYGLMFIVDPAKKTISMGMLVFKMISGFKIDWGVTTAACIIFIAPVLLVYLLFQKHIIGGLTSGAVKG